MTKLFQDIFYNSILYPAMEGLRVLIWSYAFYFTFAIVFLLSIPIAIMRCFQSIIKHTNKTFAFIESMVWILRISQYVLTYCLIFGFLNLVIIIAMNMSKKMFEHVPAIDSIQKVAVLGIKNLFIIPVSIIYLLNIVQII